jgi:hypothetical protein
MDGLREERVEPGCAGRPPVSPTDPDDGDHGAPRLTLWAALLAWVGANLTMLFAVAVSAFVHSALLLVTAVIIFQRPMASASATENGETPLAVIADSELSELVEVGLAAEIPAQETPLVEMVAGEDFTAPVSDSALASLELSEVGDFLGAGEDDMGEGLDSALGGGSANFFGVEARGSRFAYVVDISLSMAEDRLAALKVALGQSVEGLLEHTHFTIVLYNSDAHTLSRTGWIPATDQSKGTIQRDLRAMRATGGTNPIPGFEIVFAMKPRPDAIYFMTDGQFVDPERVAARIARMNERGLQRTPIHSITFIDDSGAEIMKSIARRSGGTYTHVRSVGQ